MNLKTVTLLKIYIIGVYLSVLVAGKCTLTHEHIRGNIYCTVLNGEDYVSSIFELQPTIEDSFRQYNITLSVTVFKSQLPEIEEWIYLPLGKMGISEHVDSLAIVNSSVNYIKDTAFVGFTALQTLDLSGNNFSNYSFLKNVVNLENLQLSYSNLRKTTFLTDYLQGYNNLKLINFSHCDISDFAIRSYNNVSVDLSYSFSIRSVSDYGTKFMNTLNLSNLKENFNFSLLTGIFARDLILDNNNIKTLDNNIYNFKNDFLISSIHLANNELSYISSESFSKISLNTLILSGNKLTKLTNSTFKNSGFINLDISESEISSIDSTVFYDLVVKKLDLSKNKLQTLDNIFDYIMSIQELDVSFNPIQSIDKYTFLNCTGLQILNLSNSFIHQDNIDTNSFSHLFNLKYIELSINGNFDALNYKNQFLETLVIRNSNLTLLEDYSFKEFSNLKYLYFPNTKVFNLSDEALQGLFNLKEIDTRTLFSYAGYKQIFHNLPSLEYLDITFNSVGQLNNSNFSGLIHLNSLNASFNSISTVAVDAFYELYSLEILALSQNSLSELPMGVFSSLKKLTTLYLNNNKLKSITGLFSGLDQLSFLDLSYNSLTNIKISDYDYMAPIFPYGLKSLFIQNNYISVTGLKGWIDDSALERIDINENSGACRYLNPLLLYFLQQNINYKPLNPTYDKTNIEGISCSLHI